MLPRELEDDVAQASVCRVRSAQHRSQRPQFKSLDFSTLATRSRLSPFLDLISSPHETIALHVHKIALRFYGGTHALATPILMRIASLRALESISLRAYSVTMSGSPPVDGIAAWLGSFANLRRMKLAVFALDSFSQLRDIVGACRRLEDLAISATYCANGDSMQHLSPPEPQTLCCKQPLSPLFPSLQVLSTINCSFNEQLFECLGGSASSLPLRSLSIGLEAVFRLQDPLGRLLRALGPTLKELHIRCYGDPEDNRISYEHIDLQYNTQLEVLTVSACTPNIIRRHGLSIIDQVTSRNFRRLNISLHHEQPVILYENQPKLAAIDTLLQRPNFANLEELNIGLAVVINIQEFFPRTAARDLLPVEWANCPP
ncbi:hypothetical protein FIBSPDRAFT_1044164 [Athelia psychrophila]|uniref:RNI-like protein n=1 Tax=Athelia psychrophila TaxID=1759441 RepID=A0A166K109_9AGAM|nr:hypothetical protein FIBSPDRAFT_1044164 [Fibularhizoctonia sp. CBS 109695]